ncbi:MAG TPA: hypothetical protein VKD72_28350 [Gemmataceae bacterium]|nr:hypothetical protein [Gemmataceae bacterium]
MRLLMTCVLLGTLAGCEDKAIDLGATDRKDPPAEKELKVPDAGAKVETVGLNAAVKGSIGKEVKKNVYVLVTPLSNAELKNVWWVQGAVTRKGEAYECEAQFGEADAGAGEYFAVVGIATDKEYEAGEQLKGLPAGATYTKLKIVKRPK